MAQEPVREQLRLLALHTRCILSSGVVVAAADWREQTADRIPHAFDWSGVEVTNLEVAQQLLPLDATDGPAYQRAWLAARWLAARRRADPAAEAVFRLGTGSYVDEWQCADRLGTTHWLSQVVSVEALSEASWRVAAIATDVTERHRDEAAQRAVLTNSRCILWRGELRARDGWRQAVGPQPGLLEWDLEVVDEHAGQQVVPLAPGDQDYIWALLYSRPQQDKAHCLANVWRALMSGAPGYSQEFRAYDRDGREVWLREEAALQQLGPDRWALFSVATDITEHRRAEEELRAVLTNTRCLLWHGEVRGQPGWREMAPEARDGLHWDLRVVDEHACQQVVPLDIPAGGNYLSTLLATRSAEQAAASDRLSQAALRAGAPTLRQEYRVVDRTGRGAWLSVEATIQPLGPDHWRWFSVATDITEHKRAEEELRAVLTNARCILWRGEVVASEGWEDDPDNRGGTLRWDIEVQDEAAARQLLQPAVAPHESHWLALKGAENEEDFFRQNVTAHAALRAGEPGYSQEFRCTDRHGKTFWLREDVTVQAQSPTRWLVFGVVTDITERKLAEEERLQLERRTQQGQRLESLGVLAGGIAHDFNNLLTAILGSAELARGTLPTGHEAGELLLSIETASLRAADLCRQMLAYAGKRRAVAEAVDLAALVEELTHLLRTAISKRATLRLQLAPDLPQVWGDASQMRQVLMNLVVNASEALGDADGEVRVTADEAYLASDQWCNPLDTDPLPPGRYVRIEVADTGCGMSPDTVQRIFEPFFSTKFAGRGLGLSAVLGIVRSHKGSLGVDSVPGAGTTFTLLLPATAATAAGPNAADSRAAWTGHGVILLVDDEDLVRGCGERMLRLLGFEVLTASDGLAAAELYQARSARIDLVILDLTMPRMGGVEAYARMRQHNPNVRVVVASGYGEADLARSFGDAPLAAVIHKPYNLADLRRVLMPLFPGSSGPA
ncbi:MAG: PAS domain S-box protein [Armatimonadetes bacterium]|nr:PAS domain S-box protein [Armatimonadota bacterium]